MGGGELLDFKDVTVFFAHFGVKIGKAHMGGGGGGVRELFAVE